MRRETTVVPAVYLADCQECRWMAGWSRNAMGLGAQHHDRTGHLVRVGVDRAVYFGPWPEVRVTAELQAANLTFEIDDGSYGELIGSGDSDIRNMRQ